MPSGRCPRAAPVKPVAIASAEQSEPACVAYGRREPTTGDEVHRSEQNRVLNSQRLRQTILNGHVLLITDRAGNGEGSNFRPHETATTAAAASEWRRRA